MAYGAAHGMHPDDYDPGFEDVFVKLVNRLDPPGAP